MSRVSMRARNAILLVGMIVVSLALYAGAQRDSWNMMTALIALLAALMVATIFNR